MPGPSDRPADNTRSRSASPHRELPQSPARRTNRSDIPKKVTLSNSAIPQFPPPQLPPIPDRSQTVGRSQTEVLPSIEERPESPLPGAFPLDKKMEQNNRPEGDDDTASIVSQDELDNRRPLQAHVQDEAAEEQHTIDPAAEGAAGANGPTKKTTLKKTPIDLRKLLEVYESEDGTIRVVPQEAHLNNDTMVALTSGELVTKVQASPQAWFGLLGRQVRKMKDFRKEKNEALKETEELRNKLTLNDSQNTQSEDVLEETIAQHEHNIEQLQNSLATAQKESSKKDSKIQRRDQRLENARGMLEDA